MPQSEGVAPAARAVRPQPWSCLRASARARAAGAQVDPTALISARGICISRHGRDLLIDVDLDIREREIVTLIGLNGAGKTTLVRVLLGLEKPDRGTVHRRKDLRIGYVPQRFDSDAVIPMTVERFLMLGSSAERRLHRRGSGSRRRAIRPQSAARRAVGRRAAARAAGARTVAQAEPPGSRRAGAGRRLHGRGGPLQPHRPPARRGRLRRPARLARSAYRHGALRPRHLSQPSRLLLGRAGDGGAASCLWAAVRVGSGARLRRLSPSSRSQPRPRRRCRIRHPASGCTIRRAETNKCSSRSSSARSSPASGSPPSRRPSAVSSSGSAWPTSARRSRRRASSAWRSALRCRWTSPGACSSSRSPSPRCFYGSGARSSSRSIPSSGCCTTPRSPPASSPPR